MLVWLRKLSIRIRHGALVDLVLATQFCRCLGLCPFLAVPATHSNNSQNAVSTALVSFYVNGQCFVLSPLGWVGSPSGGEEGGPLGRGCKAGEARVPVGLTVSAKPRRRRTSRTIKSTSRVQGCESRDKCRHPVMPGRLWPCHSEYIQNINKLSPG